MDIRSVLIGAAIAAVFGIGGYTAALNLQDAPGEPAAAQEAAAPLSAEQQQQVRELVRDTLVANPQIMDEVSIALQAVREQEELARRQQAITERKAQIFHSSADHVAGNPAGDVTVVEFFDYNCPYCRRAFTDIQALLDSDPNVRVVFKEFPVLSEESYDAALVGLAMQRQGLYMPFHEQLLLRQGRASKEAAMDVARAVGADMDRLDQDLADPALIESIRETHGLADELGINGTPAYVVGDQVLVGLAPLADLQAQIKAVRDAGCVVC